ncbi:MAG: serine/threonine-protein kinase [Myxococcota bacterium]
MKKPIPFGTYLLLERVNVGGMAEVFKAKSFGVEGFERLVAVKRILPSIAEDSEFVTMFVDEAKIAVQLNHANIAQIFDLGRVEDSFFIAMEYVHGKDARAIFDRARKRGETIPIPMSCYVLMKVCEALDYAHNKKDDRGRDLSLVHRDVSPQNVLISYDGDTKIIDFGIAKAANKAGKTQAGILKGKFGYMSPEQVRGLPLDRRSDIFSLGIVLYELLTGERLFVGESDFSTLEKVRNVEIAPPRSYNHRIPEELEQIVLKTLAKDADDRYQTTMDLHDDLQSFTYTSGNVFSRKDLNAYMRKMFADEIAKESARDQKFRQTEAPSGFAPSGFGALEKLPPRLERGERVSRRPTLPPPPPPANISQAPHGRSASRSSLPPPKPPASSRPPPRHSSIEALRGDARRSGVPPLASIPSLQPAGVPRDLPNASRDLKSRSSSLDANVSGTKQPKLEVARSRESDVPAMGTGPNLEMEWDDEELATQIYDRPEDEVSFGGIPSPFHEMQDEKSAEDDSGADAHILEQSLADSNIQGEALHESTELTQRPEDPNRRIAGAVAGVFVVFAALLLGIVWWVSGIPESGAIHVMTTPSNPDLVAFDTVPLQATASPFLINDVSSNEVHLIEIRKSGYRSWIQSVNLRPGEVLEVPVVLVPIPDAVEQVGRVVGDVQGTGFILDTVPSGATVYIDGSEQTERTPIQATSLTPGTHSVRVEMGADYTPWQTEIEVEAEKVFELPRVALTRRQLTVYLRSTPPGARVILTGQGTRRTLQSRTPITAAIDPSDAPWTVKMIRPGFVPWERPLPVPADVDEVEVRARLVSRPPANPGSSSRGASLSMSSPSMPPMPRPLQAVASMQIATPTGGELPTTFARSPTSFQATPTPNSVEPTDGEAGLLRVNTRPWSQVYVDGRLVGNTPQMSISLRPGTHRLTLVNPEFNIRQSLNVNILPGQTNTKILQLTPGAGP